MAQKINEVLEILYSNKFPQKKLSCDLIDLISEQLGFPRNIVKKGISDGHLVIDNVNCRTPDYQLSKDSSVLFQGKTIELPPVEETTRFDDFIVYILKKCFGYEEISTLYDDQKFTLTALTVEYFGINGYDVEELKKSEYSGYVLDFLEEVHRNNLDATITEKKLKRREIVDMLLSKRESEYIRFKESVDNIINGHYELNSDIIFNEIGKIVNSKPYKILVKPLLQGILDPIIILKKLRKCYEKVHEGESREGKITNNIVVQKSFKSIESEIELLKNNRIAEELLRILSFYRKHCDEYVGFKDSGEPLLTVIPENRTYNINDENLSIYIIIKNSGTGIARNVKIENLPEDKFSISNQLLVDILAPDENRTSKFQLVRNSSKLIDRDEFSFSFVLTWENDFNKEFQRIENLITLNWQKEDLPWEELFFSKPYNKRAIDDPTKLYGREQLLYDLQRNIEKSASITSTIIYGQKRVGKSSIVKTLNKIYERNPEIIFLYKSIGDLKNVEAIKTLQRIGDTIYKSIISDFRKKNPELINHLKDLEEPSFVGSLSPLIDLIDELSSLNPKLRLIICLDEFDELNQDFFENSELGRTFALNLGKGINDKENVGFILVGSENMTHKAKNGMRLNTYEQKRVDTFNKSTEYESYCKLISEPTKTCLKFSSDVFKTIFDLTNGNPYFTNLIMAKIFNEAYEKKISFIDRDFIEDPIEHFINVALTNNDFAHFLEDGLSEDQLKHEIGLDRRRRLLTALILAKKEKSNPKWADLKRKIKYPKKFDLTETQFEDTLKEFNQRGIIREDDNNCFTIIPPIYEKWLLGTGVYQIIADLEDKDEILEKLQQENKLRITDEDFSVLITQLEEVATKNKVIEVKSFFDQFESHEDKRRLVEFLHSMVVISSPEIIRHIKKTFSKIWSTITFGVDEKPLIKDGEILCLPESFNQNQELCELIKDTFKFSKAKTIKTINDLNNLDANIRNLIIYEPLIDCPFYYKNELSRLLKLINPIHVRDLTIHIMCFIITDEAKTAINDLLLKNFFFNFEIHDFKTFQRKEISPFYNNDDTINNPTWSLISQTFPQTSNKSTLVKLGEMIPYQSFPILWCSEISNFKPLYSSKVTLKKYIERFNLSDNLENNWNYKSETNRIEFKASLATPAKNWKVINKIVEEYKNLPQDKISVSDHHKRISDCWSNKSLKQDAEKIKMAIKHSIMKTIAGFSNSDGGKLFVGIEDDQTVQGLIYDKEVYQSEEGIRKVFDNMVSNYIGPEYAGRFLINFIELQNGNSLLEIDVNKSETEVWIRRNKEGNILLPGKEEFYIRGLQETLQLSPKEFVEWRDQRNSNKTHN